MAVDMTTGQPSVRQLQTLIRDEQRVEVKVVTGDVLAGKLRWQDSTCICIIDDSNQAAIVWRSALVYLKPIV